jgi:hypothetical protein
MVVFPSSERRPRAVACRLEGNGKPARLVASRSVAHPVRIRWIWLLQSPLDTIFLSRF